jgi:hypothetical protein
MLVRVCAFVTAVLCATSAAAQTVSDGVQAIAPGDYASAAKILHPLENTPTPDPAAQFFLAMLYETGSGVRVDRLHACTLYLRAAAIASNPFRSQADALGREILDPLPPMARDFRSAADWREPDPVTFTLGPDHWIQVDATGTTVSYLGEERYTQGHLGGSGWRFLPPKHTALNASRPSPTRRHFIELFMWRPNRIAATPAWTLAWSLSEIVGLESVGVASELNLVTIEAMQPPADFDLTSAARVQLDSDGAAEWVIAAGPNRRSATIPPRFTR